MNRLLGIIGSAMACAMFEIVVRLVFHGINASLFEPAAVGLVLGTAAGAGIAVLGHQRPIITGTLMTAIICLLIFANMTVPVVRSFVDLAEATMLIVLLGLSSGAGYRMAANCGLRRH